MKENFLTFIKSRRTIRKYKEGRIVPSQTIKDILDAGRSCQSAHNMQPWKFVVIRKKSVINRIVMMSLKKSKHLHIGFNILLKEASSVIAQSPLLIAVYNTKPISKKFSNLGYQYKRLCGLYEVQSIAAAIQNMSLAASYVKLGLAWLGIMLFCEKEINAILCEQNDLMALLSVGYSNESPKHTRRKRIEEISDYI